MVTFFHSFWIIKRFWCLKKTFASKIRSQFELSAVTICQTIQYGQKSDQIRTRFSFFKTPELIRKYALISYTFIGRLWIPFQPGPPFSVVRLFHRPVRIPRRFLTFPFFTIVSLFFAIGSLGPKSLTTSFLPGSLRSFAFPSPSSQPIRLFHFSYFIRLLWQPKSDCPYAMTGRFNPILWAFLPYIIYMGISRQNRSV